jgi:uncharacterized RDD family membrane protein YckC
MAPSDGIWFVRPKCGASNRAKSTFCFLCGDGLDAAELEKTGGTPESPVWFTSAEPVNPYEPQAEFTTKHFSFQIDSLLMVIAVIAVCLGVAHENLSVGIILAVAVVPALVYTIIVAAKAKARGTPMGGLNKASHFLIAIVKVVVVEFSGLVAFAMICVAIGTMFSGQGNLGSTVVLVAGALAGIADATCLTYLLFIRKGRRMRDAKSAVHEEQLARPLT